MATDGRVDGRTRITITFSAVVMGGGRRDGGSGRGGPPGRRTVASPELLATILDGIEEPVFVKDSAGRYIYVNDSCASMFGMPRDQALGRTDADLLPADAAGLRATDVRVMKERTTRTLEERVTAHGTPRTYQSRRIPWLSSDGDVLGVIGIARDITEQRAEQTALRESEAMFRLLADTAPVLMWTTNAQGSCDFFNAGWLQFTGVPMEKQVGEGWLSLVHPDDRAAVNDTYRRALADRRAFRTEYRLHSSDGRYHWVLDAGAPRFAGEGVFVGFVGSCIDIHDSVLQQHAVEQSAEQLERLTTELEGTVEELRRRTTEAEAARERAELTERQARFLDDASRVLQSSLDPQATLQSVADLAVPRIADRCTVHLLNGRQTRIDSTGPEPNPAIEELARRYPMWSKIGPERVARTGAPELYAEMTPDILRQASVDDEHFRLLCECGICSAMVVPMKASGRVLGTVSLLSIESARRFTVADLPLAEELARRAAIAVDNAQLYRKAEDASRAKSEFLATMSHELRTPLNAISGYTDLLQLGLSDDEGRREHLARIKASTWQLLTMIEEILTFSRLEAGTADVHSELIEAQDLVREVVDLLEPAVRHKGLELRLLMPEAPLALESDRLKIRQILMNLLSNAVKFTDAGAVTVNVLESAPDVVFQVSDTGCGIRAEQMDRIFEPFWQAETGRTRRSGGTGIGLAVAWRLAELLAGRLDAESTFGAGSRFTLRLPARA